MGCHEYRVTRRGDRGPDQEGRDDPVTNKLEDRTTFRIKGCDPLSYTAPTLRYHRPRHPTPPDPCYQLDPHGLTTYLSWMMTDPRLIQLQRKLARRSKAIIPREPGTAEAAVSLVLRPGPELEILLIKRAVHERDPWSGQMALPGGRRSPGDSSLLMTALRETHEETHVEVPPEGALLGALDEVHPYSAHLPSIIIAPYVVGVPPGTTARPNPVEVDAAIWIPVPALRHPDAISEILVELEGESRTFPAVRYGPHLIWGLTHRILQQFLGEVEEAGL